GVGRGGGGPKPPRRPPQPRKDEKIARARPMHHGGTDKARVVRKERAGQPAHRAGDHKTDKPVAKSRKADRAHTPFIRSGTLNDHAKSRINNTPDQIDSDKQQSETKIIEDRAVAQIDQASELATMIDGQAIVTAVPVE